MTGEFVEVQGTAEGAPFRRAELDAMLDLANSGCAQLAKIRPTRWRRDARGGAARHPQRPQTRRAASHPGRRAARPAVIGLDDAAPYEDVPETGATFADNAVTKARVGAQATGLITVADDSGLAVDALNGMPGVLSARWSGRHGDDSANLRLLLDQLVDVPDGRRGAAFVCAAALATPRRGAGRGRGADDPAGWCTSLRVTTASATTRSSSLTGKR